jgi:hypothetical protein
MILGFLQWRGLIPEVRSLFRGGFSTGTFPFFAGLHARHSTSVGCEEFEMPAKSKAQQKAAGAALAVKRGEAKLSDLKGASRSMAQSMSEKEIKELASTKRAGKPEHAERRS